MAEDTEAVESEEESGGKSKMKLIIIAVVALALIGGGAMFFLGGGDESEDGAEAEGKAEEVVIAKQPPIYYALDKPLVVNFAKQSNNAVRYLSVKLKVMARSQDTVDAFKLHTPAIKHALLMLFFSQKYDELNTTKGTKALRQKTLTSINEILKSEQSEGELEAVYFSSFIMQ